MIMLGKKKKKKKIHHVKFSKLLHLFRDYITVIQQKTEIDFPML